MNIETVTEFYADPTFTVFKLPKWRAYFYKFLSVKLWGNLPSIFQRKISALYSQVYESRLSAYLIRPYVDFFYEDELYLEKFIPPNGKMNYDNFQDFFTRQFKERPVNSSNTVWPCEGLLCDNGKIKSISSANIKGDIREVDTIFGLENGSIPAEYHFTNVFLHNKNYHRIHAPITGTITRIQHIPGDLIVLRPWIYKENQSLPAFRNERYNIDITDTAGKVWYLSIVGGPAVGTIELPNNIRINEKINKLDELAVFHLGSTCCMASPLAPRFHEKDCFVEVGCTY
ncbi:phosphatidylserine decarboxylase [Croceivirga thetidis]|uniref:Phosphatidylserine decarboxylase n=1 Tax=Croceivirga thetidis TaxID=2721623 RepID=A0ABX1GTA5_9FLAO|nr:phosphatidylserine decarboxylase [Croceivirga thetidis]NKI32276.1 phosphatidylserine decarboxylase [Croceivirga thetidis]